jgi:endonuclease/exonuclease/phosphatase family metal-dependent hydrolase
VTGTFRAATWNVWWRFGDPDARRTPILAELEGVKPDVIGLQEVWFADGSDLASEIAELLGYEVVATEAEDSTHWHRLFGGGEDFGVGNAVLSRWPIAESEVLRLVADDESDQSRLALSTDIDTPFGSLRFVTTHLNSGWTDSAIRSRQLSELVRWLAGMPEPDLQLLLTGDMNAGPGSDEIQEILKDTTGLVDAWDWARPSDRGFTWDRANPRVVGPEPSYRIDYVFTDMGSCVVDAELFGLGGLMPPSDHYGVAVDFKPWPVPSRGRR